MRNIFRWFFYLSPIVMIIFFALKSGDYYWGSYEVDYAISFGVITFFSTIINYFIFISYSRKYSKTSSFKFSFFLVGVLSLSLFINEFIFLLRDTSEGIINPIVKTLICLMIYIISLGIDRNRDEIILLERDVYYLESKFNRDKIENQENSDTKK